MAFPDSITALQTALHGLNGARLTADPAASTHSKAQDALTETTKSYAAAKAAYQVDSTAVEASLV